MGLISTKKKVIRNRHDKPFSAFFFALYFPQLRFYPAISPPFLHASPGRQGGAHLSLTLMHIYFSLKWSFYLLTIIKPPYIILRIHFNDNIYICVHVYVCVSIRIVHLHFNLYVQLHPSLLNAFHALIQQNQFWPEQQFTGIAFANNATGTFPFRLLSIFRFLAFFFYVYKWDAGGLFLLKKYPFLTHIRANSFFPWGIITQWFCFVQKHISGTVFFFIFMGGGW